MVLGVDSHADRITHVIKTRHADNAIAFIAPMPNTRFIVNGNLAFIAVFVNQAAIRQNLDFDLIGRQRPHFNDLACTVSHQTGISIAAQQVIETGILPKLHRRVSPIRAVVQQRPKLRFSRQFFVALLVVGPFVDKQRQRCNVIC